MPEPILDAVKAELAKQPPEPAKPEEKPLEENKPNKPEPKKPEEPVKPAEKPAEKKEDDFKWVELDKKFVTYERFKDINEKYKALKAEKDEFIKNRKDPELDEDAKEEHERLKKMWFATKDEQEQQKFQIKEEQLHQEEQQILEKEFRKLERDFDWSDWLPKFEKQAVIDRGIQNQVFDPKSAYIIMNLPSIINHFVKKAMGDGKSTPVSGKNTDIKKPDITPVDREKLKGTGLQNFLTETINHMMGK